MLTRRLVAALRNADRGRLHRSGARGNLAAELPVL
jgi:hypothetical protein